MGGDWWRVLHAALEGYGRTVTVVTLTAPGGRVLPWDRGRCGHGAGVRCSGERGCRVIRWHAEAWNRSAQARFRRGDNRIRAVMLREGKPAPVPLAVVWAMQRRGVLHRHVLLPFATRTELGRVGRYTRLWGRHRGWYGFGFIDGGGDRRQLHAWEPDRAAGYLAGQDDGHVWAAEGWWLPRQRTWVRPALLEASGVTMSLLADRRRVWAWQQGNTDLPDRLLYQPETGMVVQRATGRVVTTLGTVGGVAPMVGDGK